MKSAGERITSLHFLWVNKKKTGKWLFAAHLCAQTPWSKWMTQFSHSANIFDANLSFISFSLTLVTFWRLKSNTFYLIDVSRPIFLEFTLNLVEKPCVYSPKSRAMKEFWCISGCWRHFCIEISYRFETCCHHLSNEIRVTRKIVS